MERPSHVHEQGQQYQAQTWLLLLQQLEEDESVRRGFGLLAEEVYEYSEIVARAAAALSYVEGSLRRERSLSRRRQEVLYLEQVQQLINEEHRARAQITLFDESAEYCSNLAARVAEMVADKREATAKALDCVRRFSTAPERAGGNAPLCSSLVVSDGNSKDNAASSGDEGHNKSKTDNASDTNGVVCDSLDNEKNNNNNKSSKDDGIYINTKEQNVKKMIAETEKRDDSDKNDVNLCEKDDIAHVSNDEIEVNRYLRDINACSNKTNNGVDDKGGSEGQGGMDDGIGKDRDEKISTHNTVESSGVNNNNIKEDNNNRKVEEEEEESFSPEATFEDKIEDTDVIGAKDSRGDIEGDVGDCFDTVGRDYHTGLSAGGGPQRVTPSPSPPSHSTSFYEEYNKQEEQRREGVISGLESRLDHLLSERRSVEHLSRRCQTIDQESLQRLRVRLEEAEGFGCILMKAFSFTEHHEGYYVRWRSSYRVRGEEEEVQRRLLSLHHLRTQLFDDEKTGRFHLILRENEIRSIFSANINVVTLLVRERNANSGKRVNFFNGSSVKAAVRGLPAGHRTGAVGVGAAPEGLSQEMIETVSRGAVRAMNSALLASTLPSPTLGLLALSSASPSHGKARHSLVTFQDPTPSSAAVALKGSFSKTSPENKQRKSVSFQMTPILTSQQPFVGPPGVSSTSALAYSDSAAKNLFQNHQSQQIGHHSQTGHYPQPSSVFVDKNDKINKGNCNDNNNKPVVRFRQVTQESTVNNSINKKNSK